MFFAILYTGSGIFLLLLAIGVVRPSFVKPLDGARKLGMLVFGFGLLILGLYYGYMVYFSRTEEGKSQMELQRELNEKALKETQYDR